jgi:hypothetical protein
MGGERTPESQELIIFWDVEPQSSFVQSLSRVWGS